MIDVSRALAAVRAAPGDHVAYTKAQAEQLLGLVEQGQRAQAALAKVRAAAGAAGLSVAA